MIITPSNVAVFFLGLHHEFTGIYDLTPTWLDKVARPYPSTTESERYAWRDRIGTLREWKGPRQIKRLAAEGLEVANLPFELTYEIDKFKLMDDTYGIYADHAREAAEQSRKWGDIQMAANILANANCTDGGPMFDNAHPIDVYRPAAGTFDNDYALALTPDNFSTIRSDMMSRVGQDGQPLNVIPNLLVVPPSLEYAAMNLLNAAFIAPSLVGGNTQVGANTNVLQGICGLLVIPELATDADEHWYLLDTRSVTKPFGWQLREAPEFVARMSPQDPKVFDEHAFTFGVEARGAPINLFPFLASRSAAP